MEKDLSLLLKDLKSGDADLRKSSMEQLSKREERRAVNSLIKVVKGKLRKWIPPTRYTLEDQLNAITALAEMDDKKANDCVMGLTEYKAYEIEIMYHPHTYYDKDKFFDEYGSFTQHIIAHFYPNLRGIVVLLGPSYNLWNTEYYYGSKKKALIEKGNSPEYLLRGRIKDVIVKAQEKIEGRAK